MIQLDVTAGPNEGASFEAEETSFIIGRGRTTRIILPDSKVSARHAEVACRERQYTIRDLNSTNGTFVNGRSVNEAFLQVGDEVRLGHTVLRVAAITLESAPQIANVSLSDADAIRPAPVHARVSPESRPAVLDQPSSTSMPNLIEAYSNLLAMYKVSSLIKSNVDIVKLLDEVLAHVFRKFRAERGVVMVFDDETGELVPKASRIRVEEGEEAEIEMAISRTIVNQVVEMQEAILTTDARVDDRFGPAESIVQQDIRSAMCAPLSTKNRVLGIIYVDCRSEAGTFNKADLELLTAIANEACMAVDNQRLQEANIKAERLAAVGQTVAGLSHYIKNVLSCMEAGADVVSRALHDEDLDSIRKGWGIVNRNERKISELVLDMLSYSTERTPARAACDLNNVIEDVLEIVRPAVQAAGARLELELDPELPTIEVDPRGMHRCVLNLLNNALDAVEGREDGAVTVSTRCEGEQVILGVADNGAGIPEDVRPKIFDVFVSTKGDGGTGLGLAVVKKIVHEHAGEISVTSEPGQGAEFRIILSARPSEPPAAS